MATNKIENPTQGDTIIFKKTAEDTDGELLEFEMVIEPAASGPPQHIHPGAEEQFDPRLSFTSFFWRKPPP